MIAIVDKFNSTLSHQDKIVVSVELEKLRNSLLPLLDKADVVFTSEDFARFCGFSSAAEAVKSFRAKAKPSATIICAWGGEGADGVGPDGELKHSNAFPPPLELVIHSLLVSYTVL